MEKHGSDDDDDDQYPIELRDCIEELVKFTLCYHSLIEDNALSTQYCSTLLKDDLPHSSSSQNSLEGVPLYPLYKRLASALLKCMDSEAFCWTGSNLATMTSEIETASMQQKHIEWHKLIVQKGSEIVNILKCVSFEIHVQEPFFTQLKDGLKTVEGRCASRKYSRIETGNLILVNKSLVFEVQGIQWYPTFTDMLDTESLGKVLPGVDRVEEGVKVYRRFYTEEKELENGVLAISVSKHSLQPYIPLSSLISGLSYDGIQGLLGLVYTTGTTPNALPPPRSTLLASFNLACNPDVEGSSLTLGARALAKHACRSSSGYWGSMDGSDSNKNRLAMEVINRLIAHCCWLNMHVVPPHGVVFEIRVAEGYGARWTEDGSKFIGFLEPYMQDGYSRGWKH